MANRAQELLVELYLLKLRYTAEEIAAVAKSPTLLVDNDLRRLTLAVDRLAPQPRKTKTKAKEAISSGHSKVTVETSSDGLKDDLERFIGDIEFRRVLPSAHEFRSFLRSLGLRNTSERNKQTFEQIRKRLQGLEPRHAKQHIEATRNGSFSVSTPYLELAKTLIGS
jgi:hypothetical protein